MGSACYQHWRNSLSIPYFNQRAGTVYRGLADGRIRSQHGREGMDLGERGADASARGKRAGARAYDGRNYRLDRGDQTVAVSGRGGYAIKPGYARGLIEKGRRSLMSVWTYFFGHDHGPHHPSHRDVVHDARGEIQKSIAEAHAVRKKPDIAG